MWQFEIVDNNVNYILNGALLKTCKIEKDTHGYWLSSHNTTPFNSMCSMSYRRFHNYETAVGSFPYFGTKQELMEALKIKWLEDHGHLFKRFNINLYNNIIEFQFDTGDTIKCRIKRLGTNRISLQDTKGLYGIYLDSTLFNAALMNTTITGYKEYFRDKTELFNFLDNYCKLAKKYSEL